MTGRKLAVLFPGQGAFDGTALRTASERHPQVNQVFKAIDLVTQEQFSAQLTDILFGGEPPTIDLLLAEQPWVSQLAIFGADVAAYQVLAWHGLRPDVLVGHSLGEIAALVAANAFTVEDGARIVAERVRAVADQDLAAGRMVALAAGAARVQKIVDLVEDDGLAVAVENHDGQTVVSGPGGAIDSVVGIAGQLRIGTVEVKSPFPFHTPMLAAAVPRFAERLRDIPQQPLDMPVFSPILGRHYRDDDNLADLLATHLVTPVLFSAGVRTLYDDGVRQFVEAGCLGALSSLVRKAGTGESVTTWPSILLRNGELALDGTLADLRRHGLADGSVGERLAALVAPDIQADVFSRFWATAGGEITKLIHDRLAEFQPGGAVEPTVTETPSLDRDALGAEIKAIYSEALEYPEEVFTDDVLLEAELGVDSVKQLELLTRVTQRYSLPVKDGNFWLADHDTMGKIIDAVHGILRGAVPASA
ncbi:acyltransferase domain-containing protein [Actinophytocola sp.]|uniref:acyltransferase domain-containing protein n=1 Tax=Actinophytocola sp. TaxID=1872138 RepID=UPI002ED3BD53